MLSKISLLKLIPVTIIYSSCLAAIVKPLVAGSLVSQVSENNKSEAIKFSVEGESKLRRKDFAGAMQSYNKAIQLNPNFAETYVSRGLIKQIGFNDRAGALSDYNKAIQLNPNSARAYNSRGLLKVIEANYQGALLDLNQAIQLYPDFIEAYNTRALIRYNELKDKPGGVADVKIVIKLLKQKGDVKEAQRYEGLLKKWQAETKKAATI